MELINKKVNKSWVVALKICLLMLVSKEPEMKMSAMNHKHLLDVYPALHLVCLCQGVRVWTLSTEKCEVWFPPSGRLLSGWEGHLHPK